MKRVVSKRKGVVLYPHSEAGMGLGLAVCFGSIFFGPKILLAGITIYYVSAVCNLFSRSG